jgi:Ribbon-helix-helix protein, copG family
MSIRTTVTLDDDVMDRVQRHARSSGKPFKEALNELLHMGLLARESRPAQRRFRIKPFHMGRQRFRCAGESCRAGDRERRGTGIDGP